MIKRKNSKGLARYKQTSEEDINPMEGTSNLADAMLVLAVGIMLALIINWNVDFSEFVDLDDLQSTDVSEETMDQVDQSKALEEKGMVYMDPETGKYYIKVEGDEEQTEK